LAKALNISSFEGSAHRGSMLFRWERTYLRGVTLLPKVNTLEGRLTKQCWMLFLQHAKHGEHIFRSLIIGEANDAKLTHYSISALLPAGVA
jgi:hypothetical protein